VKGLVRRTRRGVCLCLALALVPATVTRAATAPESGAAILVTTAEDQGEGSLRAAIEQANRRPGSRIEIRLDGDAEILVETALPAITASRTRLDGHGATLREAADCRRAGGQRGCDGIVVRASGVVVKNVRVAGFTFDGLAVRGREARDVVVDRVEAIDNLDDGVGVSEGASDVVVTGCLLMGNGFRTKGKGLLVFDEAEATLVDSIVVANRDGVTVSRGAHANLDRVIVAGNYDKGVGVSSASLVGDRVQALANGVPQHSGEAVPNADGLRVGLDGRAELRRSRLAGNGDTGVVVLDRSRVTLVDCAVEGNRGEQTSTAPQARLVER
jgi:hypothetical protein